MARQETGPGSPAIGPLPGPVIRTPVSGDLLLLTYVNRVTPAAWPGTTLHWREIAVALPIALAAAVTARSAFRWQ